jgi:endonuclease III
MADRRARKTKSAPGPKVPASLGPAEIDELYGRFAAADAEPKSELAFVDPYTLLVAVVLSAQATDAGVNKATKTLFREVDTPAKMLALGEERLRERIKTIGLFNTKAKNVIALSRALVERHGGEVPRDRDALEALPGVGRKTANIVLNVAFGEPTIAVDTHVFRVANRTGLAPGKTPLEVEAALLARTPERWLRHAHHWLILHGRYVCQAKKPRCPVCLIRDICRFEPKTEGADLASPPAESGRESG